MDHSQQEVLALPGGMGDSAAADAVWAFLLAAARKHFNRGIPAADKLTALSGPPAAGEGEPAGAGGAGGKPAPPSPPGRLRPEVSSSQVDDVAAAMEEFEREEADMRRTEFEGKVGAAMREGECEGEVEAGRNRHVAGDGLEHGDGTAGQNGDASEHNAGSGAGKGGLLQACCLGSSQGSEEGAGKEGTSPQEGELSEIFLVLDLLLAQHGSELCQIPSVNRGKHKAVFEAWASKLDTLCIRGVDALGGPPTL